MISVPTHLTEPFGVLLVRATDLRGMAQLLLIGIKSKVSQDRAQALHCSPVRADGLMVNFYFRKKCYFQPLVPLKRDGVKY